MKLTFLGAARTVTGSCYLLETRTRKIVIECGMRQGLDAEAKNNSTLPFDPTGVDHIFVTHAHMDHSGMLPRAVRDGYSGQIISTEATRDLLEPMLCDSASIQSSDAEWLSRKARRAGKKPVEPLYTTEDVEQTMLRFVAAAYDSLVDLDDGIRYRFTDAGHILGSATLELFVTENGAEKKIVFSGDIGKKGNPIIRDPVRPVEADFVVMESTYGNRRHRPIKESIDELAQTIGATFARGGNVYIPSFAVGRTQDLLYILNRLARDGRLGKTDVYLDSPLAQEVTKVYIDHPECYDEEARRFLTTGRSDGALRLHFVRTVEESMRLNRLKSGGNIIIAGSGMCEGGRITHHLKHNLWKPASSVIFVGYQAAGTLGRKIVDGVRTVRVLGEDVAVLASIHTINGFSAHADRGELLDWLSELKDSPRIFLVHGEKEAAEPLAVAIREKYGLVAERPDEGGVYEL